MTQVWLTLGCICMTLGAIFFGFGADHAKGKRWQAKVGFGFLALNALQQLEQAEKVIPYEQEGSLSRS